MTTTTSTTRHSDEHTVKGRVRVWPTGLLAAACGAVATSVYAAVIDAAGVPMAAGQIGADEAQTITPANFAFGVVLCTAIATVIASMLARRAGRPVRTFVVTTVVLTAVSLVTPFAAGATATSTKLALAAAHLLAAAVVIPILTGAIRRTQPTRS